MKPLAIIFLAFFVAGCSSDQSEKITPKEPLNPRVQAPQQHTPAAPEKAFNPKEVQSRNLSSEYMYPSNKTQPAPVKKENEDAQYIADKTVTKEECIAMIGEEKFEKYTEMFSSEAAAIKRCTLLKAMQNH